jgi:hypothetical protein
MLNEVILHSHRKNQSIAFILLNYQYSIEITNLSMKSVRRDIINFTFQIR